MLQKTEPQRRLREATTTINQQIKAAEARKEALYQQDAAMIAASNVSNMCDTRHMHVPEMPPMITILGAVTTAAAEASATTAVYIPLN